MKRYLIIILIILFYFISQSSKIQTEEPDHPFYSLNYTHDDLMFLKEKYSEQQLQTITQNQIKRDDLFHYITHPYFDINELKYYEFIRTTYTLDHFVTINIHHNPYIIPLEDRSESPLLNALFQNSNQILINKTFYLNASDQPEDLVLLEDMNLVIPGDHERNYIKQDVYLPLKRLYIESLKQGLRLFISNGYRSYHRQETIYNQLLIDDPHNAMYIAKPGHSEHQTGLSIDFTSPYVNYQLIEDFEDTKEGKFIKENAYLYGFIIRYPKGKEHITGYYYEPWHLRYVGVEIAEIIHDEQITLEEYIIRYIPLEKMI